MKIYINGQCHMTKMAAMAINNKNLSRTRRPTILKLSMKHQVEELYKVCINHDSGMTLTCFKVRSTYVPHAIEWGKLSSCHLKGKTLWKWARMGKWTEDL